jgi:hypothetical protein
MTSKEISRAAGKIFQNMLPPNWAVRSQEDQEDYGIDYELEKTDARDHATGFILKAQQKGVEHLTLTPDNKSVIFSGLKVLRVKYYIDQLPRLHTGQCCKETPQSERTTTMLSLRITTP